MIKKPDEIKLTVQPIFITFHHEYVFEGPCRWGEGEALTKEFDLMVDAQRLEMLTAEAKEHLDDVVDLRDVIYIDRTEEFLITDDDLDKMCVNSDEVDVYLINPMNRCTDLVIPFAQRVRKPIVITPDALPMQSIMAAAIRARGITEIDCFRTWDETLEFLDVLRVKKALATSKVLLAARFGTTRSISGMDNFVDLETVTETLGTQFCFVNPHELLDQSHICECDTNPTTPGRRGLNPTPEEVEEMNRVTDELMEGAEECDMTRDDVFSSVRAYMTNKKFCEYYGCNAFTAPCPDLCATRRLNEERYTFCLTHSLLGEQGIPSACEYDISAVLSMLVLSSFMHKPAYMGNTTYDPKKWADAGKVEINVMMNDVGAQEYKKLVMDDDPENTFITWHSVAKRNMQGFGTDPVKYSLRPFASSGFGATLRVEFTEDAGTPITMLRFDPSCKKLFVAKGEVVAGRGYADKGCSLGMFFKVADGKDFYAKQLTFGNHIPLVYGDCFDKACALGELLGLEVVTA